MSASGVKVKICGLRDAAAARVAVESGADALGFILAPSRRQVSPEHIQDIGKSLVSSFDHLPPLVGVVVNASAAQIAEAVSLSGIDMIQLAGDETPEVLDVIDVPVIKALRFGEGTSVEAAKSEVSRWLDHPRSAAWVIVEGHAAGSYGGTGTRANWEFVSSIAEEFPIWLAGGLDPENVADAISAARPIGVDVSSGIESDGVKDHLKIESFVKTAHDFSG